MEGRLGGREITERKFASRDSVQLKRGPPKAPKARRTSSQLYGASEGLGEE